jgi:Secretion system C-terminal sorting domain
MNRITRIVFFLLWVPKLATGQNLVSNPGLDVFITCPGFGQFGNTFITDWTKPSIGSSDYYNYNCPAIPPTQEIPYNGEAYAGIIAYNFGTEYREYITGTFTSPLIAGMLYEVEFYVSLHNNYIQAIEEMGAYISPAIPGPFANALHIAVTPQIVNTTGALTDTAGWKSIYGIFMANGGEQFITIGNFNDDAATTVSQPYSIGSFGAYYFVDGVSVTPFAASGVAPVPTTSNLAVWIYSGSMHIKPGSEKIVQAEIMDYSGRIIHQTKNPIGQPVDISGFAAGIYLVRITTGSGAVHISKHIISTP